MIAAFVPTLLVQEQAAQAAWSGRQALPWNVALTISVDQENRA
jgi:hypothetical protein